MHLASTVFCAIVFIFAEGLQVRSSGVKVDYIDIKASSSLNHYTFVLETKVAGNCLPKRCPSGQVSRLFPASCVSSLPKVVSSPHIDFFGCIRTSYSPAILVIGFALLVPV